MAQMTDDQLIKRVQEGDAQALDNLYQRYSRPLYLYFRYSMRTADPEDLVHDVFLNVIHSARGFDPRKGSFRTWLFRIARNRCIDLLRRKRIVSTLSLNALRGRDKSSQENDFLSVLAADSPTAEESLIRSSKIRAVRECVDALEIEEEKQALLLYYLADRVYREIGAVFGKSTSMARKYVEAAKEKVKRCLEARDVNSM
jgi:RNA polymerase sigma-70 factor (ECF subfamily)